MSKKFLYLMVLFFSINLNNFAISEIIPPKKPMQTKEETQKKLDKALKRNLDNQPKAETSIKKVPQPDLPVEEPISEREEALED